MDQIKKIQDFWEENARKYKTSPKASWGDLLMQREISTLREYLINGDKILDVGCANGYSTIGIVKNKDVKIVGVDYSEEMIKHANAAKRRLSPQIKKRLTFQVGNALSLKFMPSSFDKIISIRCFCNLATEENQKKALLEVWRILKPGGTFLLSEPTKQGLKKINGLRIKLALEPLKEPWHNLYLDEKKFTVFTKKYFKVKVKNFSSSYYLISRFIYPSIIRLLGGKVAVESFVNKTAVKLPSVSDYGVQKLFILEKR